MMKAVAIFLALSVTTCYYKPFDPLESARKDDLNPAAIRAIENESNRLYKIDGSLKDDIYALILRSDMITHFPTMAPSMSILSLGSLKDKPNCEYLFKMVPREKMEEANKILKGKFYCFDTSYTGEQVIKNSWLASDSLNFTWLVDAHMGWFSATGDRRPIEKLIYNLAKNQKACPCIFWAVTSVSSQDELLKDMLLRKLISIKVFPKSTV